MAEQRAQRRLVAILVADIVGYSRLIEADEEGTRTRIRSLHAEVIDPRIAADGADASSKLLVIAYWSSLVAP